MNIDSRRITAGGVKAFTLVEMLLAIAIMAVVLSLFLQMTNQVYQVYRSSKQQIEAAKKTNAVISTIQSDLNARVISTGPSIFVDPVNNVLTFAILSRGPNSATGSRFMAISYTFKNEQITRTATPLLWTDNDFITTMTTMAQDNPNSSSIVVAQGVVGFRFDLVLDDGEQIPMSHIAGVTTAVTSQKYGAYYGLIFSSITTDLKSPRVRGASLAVAALDDQNAALLTSMNRLDALNTAFSTTAGTTRPPELWNNEIASDANSYPKPVISALYVGTELYSFQ